MTANGTSAGPPTAVRRVTGARSDSLLGLVAVFEELQMVLRCCERLVSELDSPAADGPDEVVVESVWTLALLSYARCFAEGRTSGASLTEDDVTAAEPAAGVVEWHRLLLKLRDHHADPDVNPREQFTIGVSQDASGAASGIAISSLQQPPVDSVTVRQTGAIAYALSGLVDGRIAARQREVFDELAQTSVAELNKLDRVDLERPAAAGS